MRSGAAQPAAAAALGRLTGRLPPDSVSQRDRGTVAMRTLWGLVGMLAADLVLGGLLEAQAVRGTLVEAVSGQPLAGGFVVLLDSIGAERARVLTNDVGEFHLVAPAPGRYRLRTEVIGLQAWTSPSLTLPAGDTVEYRVANPAPPVLLEALVVTGDRVCRGPPDEGAAMTAVWEEARKALLAVRWSEQRRALKFRIKKYERRLDLRRRIVQEDSVVLEDYSLAPFRSLPAYELAEQGYISQLDDGWRFSAPDADVVFSDPFLRTHCFALVEEARGGLLGLAFEPVPGRSVADVAGALWLDRQSAELRHLEFRYTRLPFDVPDQHIGGRVDFARLPTGAWIVREWWIRMPTVGVSTESFRDRHWRRQVLLGYKQDGGEVVGTITPAGVRPLPPRNGAPRR